MSTCPQVLCMTPDEVRLCSVDFGNSGAGVRSGKLDAGELLTGTPTVTQQSSNPSDATALTRANEAVSTTALTVNGRSCAIGECVTFTVTGGDAGAKYVLSVQCGTDSTPAQTLEAFVRVEVGDG